MQALAKEDAELELWDLKEPLSSFASISSSGYSAMRRQS
jgi:hypothetical protein